MKLTDIWFTALSETDNGRLLFISGRDQLVSFIRSGKWRERVEITWKYEGDAKGMPPDALARQMEAVQTALQQAVEKDLQAILTGVYTGDGERVWVFYTRGVPVFGERLNRALASFEQLPISIYTELDPDWEEYRDMYGRGGE